MRPVCIGVGWLLGHSREDPKFELQCFFFYFRQDARDYLLLVIVENVPSEERTSHPVYSDEGRGEKF